MVKKKNAFLILLVCIAVFAQRIAAEGTNGVIQIRSVTVGDTRISISDARLVRFKAFPGSIAFGFGQSTNADQPPIRLKCRLEGYESQWYIGDGEMFVAIRYYGKSGDLINEVEYPARGDSAGWNGSLKSSTMTHRREVLLVPEHASKAWVFISSAGAPATMGVLVVANLSVSRAQTNLAPVILKETPFNHSSDSPTNHLISEWTRDGNHPSMAKIVTIGQDLETKAYAIIDDDVIAHAEWRNSQRSASPVNPGDHLIVEWDEMYSIGVGDLQRAQYDHLPPGNYVFHVVGVDTLGNPTGADASLNVFVLVPFWRTTWFSVMMAVVTMLIFAGSWRYYVWNQVRHEMILLTSQRALERERLRIARDIHDDLGVQVTQISLVSGVAQEYPELSEKARDDFRRIFNLSRNLVFSLYETVWAVNPENDNMEVLGDYLCQMASSLCDQAQLRCRLRMSNLPNDIPVSSQMRHNISMAVKEALHNVIKHARSSEVIVEVEFVNEVLTIEIRDLGCGAECLDDSIGSGLRNMKQRLEEIGGHCAIESRVGQGTTVRMSLIIKQTVGTSVKKRSQEISPRDSIKKKYRF